MKQTGLHFLLIEPGDFRELTARLGDGAWEALTRRPGVGTARWPAELEIPILELWRDKLLRAYAGSAARAWSTLRRPYQGVQWPHPHAIGYVAGQERHRFLGARPPRLSGLPPEFGGAVQPEALLRPLAQALEAFKVAPPEQDLLLVSLADSEELLAG
jgi:hypothetical protein